MYELIKIGNVFTSKYVGTGPSTHKKRIYRAAVSQRLRNSALEHFHYTILTTLHKTGMLSTMTILCKLHLSEVESIEMALHTVRCKTGS